MLVASLVLQAGACNLDTDRPAPYAPPPARPGACGTTETLFPKLLDFLREDRFLPLREVIQSRLLPNEEEPAPDPSLRALLGALVRLVTGLGLDRAQRVVELIEAGELETKLSPLLVTVLAHLDGRLDGRTHYEAADAAALFIRRCNPDHLLTAIIELLRFESPSHQKPWITAVLEELAPLLREPALQPFLTTFEQSAERGRPAIISLLVQIMIFVADDSFAIERVETLLESAVYPVVSVELRLRIERLVLLLEEATSRDAGILVPLQNAVRCGLMYPEQRDALLGFAYDLVASGEVGLVEVLDTTIGLVSAEGARAQLGLLADVVQVVRDDLVIRDDLRELAAILLSTPEVEKSVPVLIELLESGVAAELFDAMARLLGGCGRRPSF